MSKQKNDPSNDVSSKSSKPMIVAGILLAALLIGGFVALFMHLGNQPDGTEDKPSDSQSADTATAGTAVVVSSGKGMEQDKKDVIQAAADLLNAADGEGDIQDRLKKMDEGDMSVVQSGIDSKIRFAGDLDSPGLEANTYQALMTLEEFLGKDGEVKPAFDNAWESVYVDSEAGIAHVPLAVFTQDGTLFSMEMVHVDGQWKLAPYTLLDTVRLSAVMQSGNNGSGQ